MKLSDYRIGIIGLGYVGLPLAVSFSRKFPVLGFDINQMRIDELQRGIDTTLEVEKSDLLAAKELLFSSALNVFFSFFR